MGLISTFQKIKSQQKQADAKAPKKGDWAPDFELEELDGNSRRRLSGYRGQKPVALVFGSYT